MTRYHDATTGRFVSAEYAEAHPDTTAAVKGGASGLRDENERLREALTAETERASAMAAEIIRYEAQVAALDAECDKRHEQAEEVRRELAAYRGMLSQAEAMLAAATGEGWMPIETAPKDVSQFLVTDWMPGDPWSTAVELVNGPFLADGRILNQNSGNYNARNSWTWWMPLMAAPFVPTDPAEFEGEAS